MSEQTEFRIDWQPHYAVFTLTRPDKLNALTNVALQGLEDCLDEMQRRNIFSLVIAGEGRAFCAGTDLADAAGLSMEQGLAKGRRAQQLFLRMHNADITSVAAIHGIAYGGGLELALGCTFRVAGPAARMALPEIKLALVPAYGGTQFLPALIGKSHAADMMLTGRSVMADEALRMGLVSRVVENTGEEMAAAIALMEQVNCHSQLALSQLRRCLQAAGPEITDAGLAVEEAAFTELAGSEDAAEGLTAFLEKRPPNYRNR